MTRSARPTQRRCGSPVWASGGHCGLPPGVQTAGRERRGRTWVSEPGNLYASLLLNDPAPPAHFPELSFVAALALHDAVAGRVPGLASRLALKWPNDLLIDRNKFAGILIEGEGAPLSLASASIAPIIPPAPNIPPLIWPRLAFARFPKRCSCRCPRRWSNASRNGSAGQASAPSGPIGLAAPRRREDHCREIGRRRSDGAIRDRRRDWPPGSARCGWNNADGRCRRRVHNGKSVEVCLRLRVSWCLRRWVAWARSA